MLFAWIDKRSRLDDELAAVERGDSLNPYGLSRFRVGRAVIGIGEGGVFATTQHREGDACTVVWGELYNRTELGRIVGQDSSVENDAGLLAALLTRLGPEGLARANGQFALVQWDDGTGRFLAATDHFGILPLRYTEDDDRLIVASDARMILSCPGLDDRLDAQAIYDYVSMDIIPAPWTAYASVRKLPPRHALVFDGRTSVEAYHRLRFDEDASGSQDEMGRQLRDVIRRAVERRRESDPSGTAWGAFLSGGLDSSTVLGTLAELSAEPTRAFTIGFDEARFDEMRYARLAAERFGAQHYTYNVTAADTSAIVDALLDQYDEPFGNSSAVPVYYCAKLAADAGLDTLYGGDGGDELFAGNPQYLRDRTFQIYQAVPRWLRRGLIEPVAAGWPLGDRIGLIRKARSYIRRANTPNPERIAGYGFLETVAPADVFNAEFLSMVDTGHPMAVQRGHYERAGASSELYRILHQDLALVVADNDLRKVTEMSARAGIRVVYPMLDPDVVELAGRIPASWHLRGFKLRAFYKRAMRGWLPDEILAREKMGFGLPVSVWFKQDAQLRQRLGDAFASRVAGEVFASGFLDGLRSRTATDPTNYYGSIAWVVLILIEWLNRFARTRGGTSLTWHRPIWA